MKQDVGSITVEPISRRKILLVEDDPLNQEVAAGMLIHQGYDVDAAMDGHVAIEKACSIHYDLIFMDCQLPTLDGLEVCRVIRDWESQQQRQRTPVIAMTACAMKGDRERCLAAGMDDYLSKPFALDTLATMLENWVPAH